MECRRRLHESRVSLSLRTIQPHSSAKRMLPQLSAFVCGNTVLVSGAALRAPPRPQPCILPDGPLLFRRSRRGVEPFIGRTPCHHRGESDHAIWLGTVQNAESNARSTIREGAPNPGAMLRCRQARCTEVSGPLRRLGQAKEALHAAIRLIAFFPSSAPMTGSRPGRIVVTIPDALNSDLREVTAIEQLAPISASDGLAAAAE